MASAGVPSQPPLRLKKRFTARTGNYAWVISEITLIVISAGVLFSRRFLAAPVT